MKAVIAVAVILSLAGLGGAPASAQQNVETVRITNIGTDYWAGPLYVAQREKLFEKHGLRADVTVVKGGSLALQTVLTKQSDVAMLSYEHIVKAASKGQRVVAVYRLVTRPLNNLVVKDSIAQGTRRLDLASRVRRLKGLRIGVPSAGGSGEQILHVLATKYGLKVPGDFTTVYLGSDPASYVAAFQHDQIDAALPVEPAGVLVEQAGFGKTLINFMRGEVPEFDNLIYMCLAVHPDTLRERPDFVRKVAATFNDAMRVLKAKRSTRGTEIMAAEFPALSSRANEQTYGVSRAAWSDGGRMSLDQARRVLEYMTTSGGLTVDSSFDLKQTFTNDFVPR